MSRSHRRAGGVGFVVAAAVGVAVAVALMATPAVAAGDRCALRSAESSEQFEGPTDYRHWLRPRATIRARMIFVDFSDAPAGAADTPDDYHQRAVPPGQRWITSASYKRTRLSVLPHLTWLRMSRPSTGYGSADGITYDDHRAYIAEAVRLADPAVDFRRTDLLYVVSSRGAATPVSSFVAGPGGDVVADGTRIGYAATLGGDDWDDGVYAGRVLAHETLHTFGLPDLYVYGAGSDNEHRHAGAWDLMGWLDPGFGITAWHARKLGWLSRRQIVCIHKPGRRTVSLSPVARRGGIKAVVVKTGSSRAYVVETRQRTGLDRAICQPGVLIYEVDARAPSGSARGPIVVSPASRAAIEPCGALAAATYGRGGGRVSTFTDRTRRVRVNVLADRKSGSRVRVTRTRR